MTETILLVGGPRSGDTPKVELLVAAFEVTVPVLQEVELVTWANEHILTETVRAVYTRRPQPTMNNWTPGTEPWPYDYQPTPAQRATMAVEREAEGRVAEAQRILRAATADREEADRKAGM